MKSLKMISVLAVVVLASITLAACGGQKPDKVTDTTPARETNILKSATLHEDSKTEYQTGDTFDFANTFANITYVNDLGEEVALSKYNLYDNEKSFSISTTDFNTSTVASSRAVKIKISGVQNGALDVIVGSIEFSFNIKVLRAPQVFEKSGMKITITGNNVLAKQSDAMASANGMLLLIASDTIGIGGNRQSAALFTNGLTLREYTQLVVASSPYTTSDISNHTDENVNFDYFTYTATAQGMTFKYFVVTLKGDDHFYVINFYTLANLYNGLADDFMAWAKLVEVE